MPTRGHKWRDLHAELLQGIRSGRYPVGARLPSIPDLLPAWRSDSTIKRAYQELRAAGLVESRRGSGHWVIRAEASPGLEQRLASVEQAQVELRERVERLERGGS